MVRKKRLDEQNTLLFTPHFPYNISNTGTKRATKKALLGIGGNIGNVVRRFEHLLGYLDRSALVHVLETAPILKNPPFGYTEQADFYNSLLLVETQLTAKMLLRYVLGVEKLFGRKRSFQDAPRTLDIDIIFYEKVKMETQELTLPHPGWKDRSSVLIPLTYLSRQGRSFYEKSFSDFLYKSLDKSEMNDERALPILHKRI